MIYLDICRAELPLDEAKRSKPYRDTVGKLRWSELPPRRPKKDSE